MSHTTTPTDNSTGDGEILTPELSIVMHKMAHMMKDQEKNLKEYFDESITKVKDQIKKLETRIEDLENQTRASRNDYFSMKESIDHISFAREKYGNHYNSLGTRMPGPVRSNLGQSPLLWK